MLMVKQIITYDAINNLKQRMWEREKREEPCIYCGKKNINMAFKDYYAHYICEKNNQLKVNAERNKI